MICVKSFGECHLGHIDIIMLQNEHISMSVLSLGATVQSIMVPNREGKHVDVCLGFDTIDDYVKNRVYMGACVGRYANRIADAGFTLGGQHHTITANEGKNHLHGGNVGFDKKLWDYTTDEGTNSVTFTLTSPNMEEGFPGNLKVTVTYALSTHTLEISYTAQTDRDTIVNLTNHTYFNLSGHDSGTVENHTISINAEHYTPFGEGNIPTGEIAPVGGAVDLRQKTHIGDRIHLEELSGSRGFDHNFVLAQGHKSDAAVLYSPTSGIRMDVRTTKPGMQLYTAGFLERTTGKHGATYAPHHGVCLETQFYPNSPNCPHFPSAVLRVGETYRHTTSFSFGIE